MKNKFLHLIWAVLFFLIVSYLYGEEFVQFQDEKTLQQESVISLSDQMKNFSWEDISQIPGEKTLYYTPYLGLLDQIIKEIDAAEQSIYLEAYIFTERDIKNALIRAHKRGIEVKVLLENNPYKAPYLNDSHFNDLSEAWVDVRWSDPLNYSLNHSKLLMIDDSAYISTGNFSYSLFKYNRDFIVKLEKSWLQESLKEIFENDFKHIKITNYHENLVISPDYSRDKMESIIDWAKEDIRFYFPYFSDEGFQEKLIEAAKRWVRIQGLVEKDFFNENKDHIQEFTDSGIEIRPLIGDKLHAKAFLVDDEILYIWSINFSRYSFDENREIGLLLKDNSIISDYNTIFNSDF